MSYGPADERSRAPVNHQLLPLTSTPAPSCGEPDLPPPRCCNSLAQGEVSRSLRQQRTPRAPRDGLGARGEPWAEPLGRSALLVPPYLRWARPRCSRTAALHHHVWDTATTSSPMPGHHLLQTSPGGPTVSPCHGSAEPAGRERDPQPPAPQRHRDGKAPGVLGEGEQRGRGAAGPGFVPAAPSTHLAAALRWGRRSRAALHTQDTAPATAPPAQAPSW